MTDEAPIDDPVAGAPHEPEAWVRVGSVAELERRQRLLVRAEPDDIVVWWYQGCPHGLRNVCIHDERALAEGSLLGSRVVCPGHQWAFEVETGYCRERDRYQPVHPTRVEGGEVFVSLRSLDRPRSAPTE